MAKDVSFSLDISGAGEAILQNMAMPVAEQAARQIQARAQAMANSLTSDPPTFQVTSKVGRIKRGERAIATVSTPTNNARESYIAHTALSKARDAGRLN